MISTNIIQLVVPSIKDYIKLKNGEQLCSGRIIKWNVDITRRKIDFVFIVSTTDVERIHKLPHRGAAEFSTVEFEYKTTYYFDISKKELFCQLSSFLYSSSHYGYAVSGSIRLNELMDQNNYSDYNFAIKNQTDDKDDWNDKFSYLDLE